MVRPKRKDLVIWKRRSLATVKPKARSKPKGTVTLIQKMTGMVMGMEILKYSSLEMGSGIDLDLLKKMVILMMYM